MEKKLDPFGVIIISFLIPFHFGITAIGGGTLRGVMIGNLPVGWLRNESATITIFFAAIGSMFFKARLRKSTITLFLFDTLGLNLFTLVGIKKAIHLHFSIAVCIALGIITASFGGVIRDPLLNNMTLIFWKEIYATASIIGGLIYFLFRKIQVDEADSKIICIVLIFVIRLIAVKYKFGLPAFYSKKLSDI